MLFETSLPHHLRVTGKCNPCWNMFFIYTGYFWVVGRYPLLFWFDVHQKGIENENVRWSAKAVQSVCGCAYIVGYNRHSALSKHLSLNLVYIYKHFPLYLSQLAYQTFYIKNWSDRRLKVRLYTEPFEFSAVGASGRYWTCHRFPHVDAFWNIAAAQSKGHWQVRPMLKNVLYIYTYLICIYICI